jgi:hypothetical protein
VIFATFDLEVVDDSAMLRLERARPEWPWWWMRLVCLAKRANEKGRILQGRLPVTAEDLAMIHHRDPDRAQDWQALLDRCVDLGLLTLEDQCYTVADWRRWHRKPSDEPDQAADRKARSRDLAIPRVTSRDNDHVTHVTPQSRAEQSIAEQTQSRAEQTSSSLSSSGGSAEEVGPEEEEVSSVDLLEDGLRRLLRDQGSRQRVDMDRILSWSGEPLASGEALPEDVLTAMQYGLDAARHAEAKGANVRSRWNYAQTVAAEQLENAARRRRMAQEARERGHPPPRPFRYDAGPPGPS